MPHLHTSAIIILLLYTSIYSGNALRCWYCHSKFQQKCTDYLNVTEMSTLDGDIPVLKDCNGGKNASHKQVCMKRIINMDFYGQRIITRDCATVNWDENPETCPDITLYTELCEYCNTDGCNNTSKLQGNDVIILSALLLLQYVRRLFEKFSY